MMRLMQMSDLKYHPYIDGLRAFAVTVVFLFHLNPDLFPGGYLGVDVFFVISGFVISQSLYKDYLKTGKLDIGQFYLRRFKRLYPALVTMVLITTSLYFFFGFLWDTNLFLKSSVTSVLAVSNLYYLKQGENYFHQDLINPLLHTWSLGIEEQFYFIYPLILFSLLWVTAKRNFKVKFLSLILFLVSLLCYLIFVLGGDVWGNYYFPIARFWELGIGCALFFIGRNLFNEILAKTLSFFGILALIALQFKGEFLDNVYIETLLAVIATAIVILAGLKYEGLINKYLSFSFVVFLGTISYSLYLWHLPVIYFLNLYTPTAVYYVAAPSLTFLLAIASYYWIESPWRHAVWLDVWLKRGLYGLIVALIILTVWSGVVSFGSVSKHVNSWLNDVAEQVKKINWIESKYQLGARIEPFYLLGGYDTAVHCAELSEQFTTDDLELRSECWNKSDSDILIYLTGDSHATHLTPMLNYSGVDADIYFHQFPRRAIVNEKGMPINTDEAIAVKVEELKKLSSKYEKIYFMSSMYLSTSKDQPEVIKKNLGKMIIEVSKFADVILVAPTPVFPTGPESCVVVGVHCNLNTSMDKERRNVVLGIINDLESSLENVYVLDLSDKVCNEAICSIYDRVNDLVKYRDGDHFSVEGSKNLSSYFNSWFQIINE